MRAIVREGSGAPDVLTLREVETPVARDDEVLVRVRAASVNALDAHMLKVPLMMARLLAPRGRRFIVPGVDLAGTVEAVGRRVEQLKPGDEVFGTANGAFAEYATTRADHVVLKPPAVSFEAAAALPVAGLTALQGLRDKGRVQPGQRVLVHGAGGGVGTFAVQIAKVLGAHVTAVTGTRNLDVVRALGPDEIIDYTREDFAARGEGFDVFFDVAATRSIKDCLRVLVPKGTLVQAGAVKDGGWLAILRSVTGSLVMARVASQRIVMFVSKSRRDDLVMLAELVESGRVKPAIDRECGLSEVPEAVRYVASGQARAKVVIRVDR